MEDYQERVVGEQKELAEKVNRLRAFIAHSSVFKQLDMEEKIRLRLQFYFMVQYSDILEERIANFG